MKLDQSAIMEEVQKFKAALAPNDNQKIALRNAEVDISNKLKSEREKTKKSIEMVFLVAICGELKTNHQKAEFLARLLLVEKLLKGDTE